MRRPLLLLLACSTAACSSDEAPRMRGAVVILLDTLRTDRLGTYGHDRPTSPSIDALAAEGVVFERAVSNCSWTLPASVGLLTGTYPTREQYFGALELSLVEDLRDAGFATAAFTEGGYFSKAYGLDLGFDTYVEEESEVRLAIGGQHYNLSADGGIEATFAKGTEWLREHAGGKFFLLLHTYEAHSPYVRRDFVGDRVLESIGETFDSGDIKELRRGNVDVGPEEVDYLGDLYDGGVRAVDTAVGDFLATLEELGLADDTLVVITSDHGEDLGERVPSRAGDHGHSLYDEQVRIPLILRAPGVPSVAPRIPAQVRNIDVLPTVLELLNVRTTKIGEGRSLVPFLEGAETADRVALSWTTPPPLGKRSNRAAYSDGTYKLLTNGPKALPKLPTTSLFDIRKDPGEQDDLSRGNAEVVRRLRDEMEALRARLDAAGPADYRPRAGVSEALRRRLNALGYAEGDK